MSRSQWPDGPQMAVSMTPADMQTLKDLASKYGSGKIIQALSILDDGSRSTALDSPTFSATSVAPSMCTTTSAPWSCESSACTSDVASIDCSMHSQQPYSGGDWPDTPMTTVDSPISPLSAPAFPDLELKPFTLSQSRPSSRHPAPPRSVPQSPAYAPPFSPNRPRKRTTSNPHRPPVAAMNASTSAASTAAAAALLGPKKPISCPICALHELPVGFGRKSDFKKHLSNFHVPDALWVCPAPGCRVAFDFEKAYVAHARSDHGISVQPGAPSGGGAVSPVATSTRDDQNGLPGHCSPDAVRVQTCPQVVFACGFLGCKEVIEAKDDNDAPAAAERWMEHLCAHFDRKAVGTKSGARGTLAGIGKGVSSTDNSNKVVSGKKRQAVGVVDGPAIAASWTYYTQIQNLLRQSDLKDAWKAASWNKGVRNALRWQPRSSGDLKKVLETRHFGGDVPRLLHAAFTLGSSSFADPEMGPPGNAESRVAIDGGATFLGEAARPILGGCPFAEDGHQGLQGDGDGAGAFSASSTMRRALKKLDSGFSGDDASGSRGFRTSGIPRCVPEEPDSLEYAHPGTPFAVPETDTWANDDGDMFGPPEEDGGIHGASMFDPTGMYGGFAVHHGQDEGMGVPGLGVQQDAHPLSAWAGVESLGAFPSEQDVIGEGSMEERVDDGHTHQRSFTAAELMRSPKRGFGWMRGSESHRLLKKRGGPLCDDGLGLHLN